MKIDIVKTGYLEENCYILSKGKNVLVIDPGDDFEKIKESIENKNVIAVLITHYHFDHIGALDEILKEYNPKIINYKSKKNIEIENFKFEIIDTKGHKEDCVSYYFKDDKKMFVGDFIFRNSIGRCDLPGGDFNEMKKSLNKIKKYDRDIILYPGHGPSTTIGYELINNTYIEGGLNE